LWLNAALASFRVGVQRECEKRSDVACGQVSEAAATTKGRGSLHLKPQFGQFRGLQFSDVPLIRNYLNG